MRGAPALLVLLLAPTAHASIGPISLEDLIRGSDLIVIATVRSVDLDARPNIATADVREVVSGASGAIVRFIAEPQMRCSVATAMPGERVLLFLSKSPASELATIAAHGYGRLPLQTIDDVDFAVWPQKVWLWPLRAWAAPAPSDEAVVVLAELLAEVRRVRSVQAREKEASSLRTLQHRPD
jgi:hypothetical protein